MRANNSEDVYNDHNARFNKFNGFEWSRDVRRVLELVGRSLRRFEMWLGHRDCCTVSTSKIECFILTSKL